ncbi:MAG: ComF family protein [Candidatus Omnitrophica bacterium]|jgi:ComF family protein|nr:ComF family protein [Candidatus Omnitrophota bacterium]MDD5661389.1 ComF family protein [Candidatus Omnitrophota bacterium]
MLACLLKGIKDLIYPDCCLVCKNKIETNQAQNLICANCLGKIENNLPPFCSACGRHLDTEAIKKNSCNGCKDAKFYFDRAFSPCVYTGTIKKLIHEFKYCNKDYLGKTFGAIMNEFIHDYNLPIQHFDYIIPVPLHKSRLREREFNQAQIIGRQVAERFGKKLLTDAFIRNKPTKTQATLSVREREQNIKGSFLVTKPELIKDTNLLLIDDVLTTAATSNEAAKTLKAAGAKTVILLTLAS